MALWQDRWRQVVLGNDASTVARLARWGLRSLTPGYACATAFRNLAYDQGWRHIETAPVPVISVGNLTVGGTGKTPLVEYLGRWLRQRQLRVAILSRGYGAADGPNDEALLLEENLPDVPHLQGRDRTQLAAIAVEELESEVLVLDDGFQHRRLKRDLDLVLLDASHPFGGGWQLPGGLLRESATSLRRADMVLLTRSDQLSRPEQARLRDQVRRLAPDADWGTVRFPPTSLLHEGGAPRPVNWLNGKRVLVVSGIGNPASFRRTVEQLGATIVGEHRFPDHHAYQRADIDGLRQWTKGHKPDAVVTTQKDLVKLRLGDLARAPLLAVRIAAEFEEGEAELHRRLEGVLTCARS